MTAQNLPYEPEFEQAYKGTSMTVSQWFFLSSGSVKLLIGQLSASLVIGILGI